MRNIFIMVYCFFCGVLPLIAQQPTHSELSNNQPSALNDGYVFNFLGSPANNCGPEAYFDFLGSDRFSWAMSTFSSRIILTDQTGVGSDNNYYSIVNGYNGDCNLIDIVSLNLTIPCTVRMQLKTSDTVELFVHLQGSDGSTYFSTNDKKINIFPPTDEKSWPIYEFEFNASDNCSGSCSHQPLTITDNQFVSIRGLGLSTAGYNNNEPCCGITQFPLTIEFDWIEIGNASHLANEKVNTGYNANVYPNPIHDFLNLVNLPQGISYVEISSLTGELVYQQQINSSAKIDMQNFTTGVYFVKIENQGNVDVFKIVKD